MYQKQKYMLDKEYNKIKAEKLPGVFIAGGARRAAFAGEKMNDLDI